MPKEYVRQVEGAYRIGDTRVSLDSLVYLFLEGMSAESMVESYPALTLEQVHGALAFYLGHQREVDSGLAEGERTAALLHEQSVQTNAELIAKLRRVSLAESLRPAARFYEGTSGSFQPEQTANYPVFHYSAK